MDRGEHDTYQEGRSVTDQVSRRLVVTEAQTQVVWELFVPLVELIGQRMELLQRDGIGGASRIEVLKSLCKNLGHSEKSQSTRYLGQLTREGRTEALFSNIFIVNVSRKFSCDVTVAKQHRHACCS